MNLIFLFLFSYCCTPIHMLAMSQQNVSRRLDFSPANSLSTTFTRISSNERPYNLSPKDLERLKRHVFKDSELTYFTSQELKESVLGSFMDDEKISATINIYNHTITILVQMISETPNYFSDHLEVNNWTKVFFLNFFIIFYCIAQQGHDSEGF